MTLQNDTIAKVRGLNEEFRNLFSAYYDKILVQIESLTNDVEFRKFVDGTEKGQEMNKDLKQLEDVFAGVNTSQKNLYAYTNAFLDRQQNEINNQV